MWRTLLLLIAAVFTNVRGDVPEFIPVGPSSVGNLSWIVYANDRFVAVGASNIVYSLDDGVSWTLAVGFPLVQYTSIAFGDGKFVAVSTEAQSAESFDGIHWRPGQLGPAGAIAYGNGQFATDPIGVAFVSGKFVHASEITNLPPISEFEQVNRIIGIAGLDDTLVAVGLSFAPASPPRHALFVSQSGPTGPWTLGPHGSYFYYAFSTGKRLLGPYTQFAGPPGFEVPFLTDFIFPTMDSQFPFFAAAESPTAMVALGYGPYSRTTAASPGWVGPDFPPNYPLVSFARNSRIAVAIGSYTDFVNNAIVTKATLVVATNRLSVLTQITPPAGANLLSRLRYADGKFVGVGNGGTIIRSIDGTNWSKRLSNTSSDFYDLVHGTNGLWVAVGDNGKIVTSTDASSFSVRFSGTDNAIYGITYGSGEFVGVGEDGVVVTSQNGIDWNASGTEEIQTLYSVAYGNGRFVAVGTNAIVQVSTNAIDWIGKQIPNAGGLMRIAFANGSFVALATNNIVLASRDGLTWDSTQLGSFALAGLDESDGELWITGDKSTIWKTSDSASLAPTIRLAVDSEKRFQLTLEVKVASDYRVEATKNLATGPWGVVATLSNVQASATWTDANALSDLRFYRAVKQ